MSWRTLSLWRRSTLKETRYRRTRSTGERSCWRCPAFARSTPPSSAFEAPVYSSPAGFSVRCSRPACPTCKRKKRSIRHSEHTPASLNCAVTPYANTYSNFELTHTSFDTRVHSLTHAMVLILRLDINGRKIAPTHPQRFLELSFAICFLDCFACGWQKQGAMALAPLPLLPLYCNHMRRESIQCEGRPKCQVKRARRPVSVHPWVETVYNTIHSFKKGHTDIRFKGKFHCITESPYYLLSVLPIFSFDSNLLQTSEGDSGQSQRHAWTPADSSWVWEVVLQKLALLRWTVLIWIKVLIIVIITITTK